MIIKKLKQWNRKRNELFRKLKFRLAFFFFDRSKNDPLEVKKINKVLILRDDNKIGDMVVSTGIFKYLHDAGKSINVIAGKDNVIIIKDSPIVCNYFIYRDNFFDVLKLAMRLRRENYDMLMDFGDYISPMYYMFISLVNAKHTLGFNKKGFRRYNINIDYRLLDAHITERYKRVLNLFGLNPVNYNYFINIPISVAKEAESFLLSLTGKKRVIINPFTANSDRDLSLEQITGMIEKINSIDESIDIVLIGSPQRINSINISGKVIKSPFTSFFSAVYCVQHADLVISPDTVWVHIARAYDKPLIALYGSNIILGGFINNKVWAPNYSKATQIITQGKTISSIPVEKISCQIERYLA